MAFAHHWASHRTGKSQGRVFGLKKGQNKILTIGMLTIKQLFRFQHVLYRDRLEQVQYSELTHNITIWYLLPLRFYSWCLVLYVQLVVQSYSKYVKHHCTFLCRKFVHSVDKTTGSRQKSIPYSLAGVGRPYDIVNVPQECPNISNSCQVEAS